MKNYNKIFFSLALLLPFITLAQDFDPNSLLPESLKKYKFGMSLDDFIKENKSASNAESRIPFRHEYKGKDIDKDIKEVTWYFDAENNKPLYEVIIEFNDEESLNSLCSKKLGEPNDREGKWKRQTKEGYIFKAWRFDNKLVYVLVLPFTEWAK